MTRSAPPLSSIAPGWIALHGNQSESLAQAVIAWLRQNPLDPLEEEIVLVQSNGVAEWFKMELARQAGVCAATRVELPGRFLWRTYRQVLGAQAVPRVSPLDKRPMAWRLMRLLPGLLEGAATQQAFAPVRGYLQGEGADRALQLATRLADLFDQYQNYRIDWLQAWAQGREVLIDARQAETPVPADQRWQPLLWRALLDDLAPEEHAVLRPGLHGQVIERLRAGPGALAGRVARRVVVFGMSHLPGATLDTLEALAAHTQVVLAVPNPCRYHWGDIVEGRELLRHIQKRRHGPRPEGMDLSTIAMEDMHQHAHPLLAAWGRQGRDFIRQLDARDQAEQVRAQYPQLRVELFDEDDSGPDTPLLTQLQRHIRDLVPQAEAQARALPLAPDDRSLVFHLAHSPVRELEVLHDQLLDRLAERRPEQAPLQPRDIVVMVPDIEAMAPAIRAVFGQYPRGDARHIPFDIADLSAQASSPLVTALEWLLRLPAQRCCLSELVDLLAVPAVAARFGIAPEQLPRLGQWMQGAGIRWGLNGAQRKGLDLDTCGEQNSAWFGLQRMLLGYAAGAGPEGQGGDGIAPYAEVGGLDAELAGGLAHLLQTLLALWGQADEAAPPATWAARGHAWLDALFLPQDALDRGVLAAMRAALATWLDACEQAGFDQLLALAAFRSAWLEALEPPLLERRFRAGGVTFCTLMPMRAIPFEVVCLLGMNDGDYPRRSPRSDFDLMGQPGHYRPGDRARQHDDRQLMLEALLSARRLLYVSWTGRHVRDNSELPPSVLVAQLRDHLAAVWGEDVVKARTTAHPLQPFSRRYFEEAPVQPEGAAAQGQPLSTHAREWRVVHAPHRQDDRPHGVAAERLAFDVASAPPLTLARLESFLRNPVKVFFRERLGVVWPEAEALVADTEAFAIDGLNRHGLLKEQLRHWPPAAEVDDVSALCAQVDARLVHLRRAGRLPLRSLGQRVEDELRATLHAMAGAWWQAGREFPCPAPRLLVEWATDGLVLRDALAPLWDNGEATAWLALVPSKLLSKDQPRADKLLAAWLRALVASAMGRALHQRLVGQDAVLRIAPLPPEAQADSQATLRRLLATWNGGQQAPLPLPLKTALAAVQAQENAKEEATPADLCDPDSDANATAQKAYEGGDYSIGFPEVQDPSLARVFPDFEALLAAGTLVGPGGDGAVPAFHGLAQALYRPMLEWAKTQVEFTPHSTAPYAAHEGEPA